MEHHKVLHQGQVIRYRIAALKKRPEHLALMRRLGRESACGEYIEIDGSRISELAKSNHPSQPPAALADRVELGLCGRHREAWAAAGRPLRTPEQNAALKAVCAGCDAKWHGIDKALCRNQPCTVAGRWAATYRCPAGKWPQNNAFAEGQEKPN